MRMVASSDPEVNELSETSNLDDRTDTLSGSFANIVFRIFTKRSESTTYEVYLGTIINQRPSVAATT